MAVVHMSSTQAPRQIQGKLAMNILQVRLRDSHGRVG